MSNTEVDAAFGNSTIDTRLDRHENVFAQAFLGQHAANDVVGNSGSHIDGSAQRQLHGGAPANHLAHGERQGFDCRHRHHEVAAERRIIGKRVGLAVIQTRVVAKPGTTTCLGCSVPVLATRLTCASTLPP